MVWAWFPVAPPWLWFNAAATPTAAAGGLDREARAGHGEIPGDRARDGDTPAVCPPGQPSLGAPRQALASRRHRRKTIGRLRAFAGHGLQDAPLPLPGTAAAPGSRAGLRLPPPAADGGILEGGGPRSQLHHSPAQRGHLGPRQKPVGSYCGTVSKRTQNWDSRVQVRGKYARR